MKLNTKITHLYNLINNYNKIIVAFSGGVDSGTIVFLCKLLNKEVLAVTALSETYPEDEIEFAKKFLKKHKIKHKIIKTEELKDHRFAKNTILRCYYCKTELYKKLTEIKNKYHYDVIFDGVNYDDIKTDFRPGIKSAQKFGIVHPFVEAKVTKNEIRKIAKKFGLSIWNKHASACLASRIPFGTKITSSLLKKVYCAEKIISSYWKNFFRVRHHNEILRIELQKNEIKKFLNKVNIDKLVRKLHSLGYKFITLDLEGYIPAGKRYVISKNKS